MWRKPKTSFASPNLSPRGVGPKKVGLGGQGQKHDWRRRDVVRKKTDRGQTLQKKHGISPTSAKADG